MPQMQTPNFNCYILLAELSIVWQSVLQNSWMAHKDEINEVALRMWLFYKYTDLLFGAIKGNINYWLLKIQSDLSHLQWCWICTISVGCDHKLN